MTILTLVTNKEYSILKFALTYGLATRPNGSNILTYAEDIWEQIDKSNICRNELYSKSKIKKELRGLAFQENKNHTAISPKCYNPKA